MAKILVVDDDPDFVEVTSTILKSEGHEVAVANSGKQALASMETAKPDLVVLDVMMSYVLDGLDVTEAMSQDQDLKLIPILMVSSLPSTRYAEMFPTDRYVPIDDWLSKPVAPAELVGHVDKLLH